MREITDSSFSRRAVQDALANTGEHKNSTLTRLLNPLASNSTKPLPTTLKKPPNSHALLAAFASAPAHTRGIFLHEIFDKHLTIDELKGISAHPRLLKSAEDDKRNTVTVAATKPRDLFATLPDEVAIRIFMYMGAVADDPRIPYYLANAATVCQRWDILIRDNILWMTLCRMKSFQPILQKGQKGSWQMQYQQRQKLLPTSSSSSSIVPHPSSVKLSDSRSNLPTRLSELSMPLSLPASLPSSSSSRRGRKRSSECSEVPRRRKKTESAHWKHVYRQNHLTIVNWKRGSYRVQPVVLQRIQTQPRPSLFMSFDDKWVVTVSLGAAGHLWDIGTGEYHMELSGHEGVISTVKFDRSKVVTGGIDATLKVWDIASQRCTQTLLGHEGEIVFIDYDDAHIVSGSEDMTLRVWQLNNSSEALHVMRGHTGAVCCLKLQDKTVVSGSTDTTLKIWSLETGTCEGTLQGHQGHVYCLQTLDDVICSGSGDCTIRIWSQSGKRCVRTLKGHSNGVVCIQFDFQKIVSGSSDHTVRVWDYQSGMCLYTLQRHTGTVWNLRFSDRKLFTSSFDESMLEWDFTWNEES